MIKNQNHQPTVMEFTSFNKHKDVSDRELLSVVRKFETEFLSKQPGILFHCLVRNMDNTYANVLFAKSKQDLDKLFKAAENNSAANKFFSVVDEPSVNITYHKILKSDFKIPSHFSCIELGMFTLKEGIQENILLNASKQIENQYLNKTTNTQAYFIGNLSDHMYSEVVFGETLAQTQEVCNGYLENSYCKTMLDMIDESSTQLDFWYLIG